MQSINNGTMPLSVEVKDTDSAQKNSTLLDTRCTVSACFICVYLFYNHKINTFHNSQQLSSLVLLLRLIIAMNINNCSCAMHLHLINSLYIIIAIYTCLRFSSKCSHTMKPNASLLDDVEESDRLFQNSSINNWMSTSRLSLITPCVVMTCDAILYHDMTRFLGIKRQSRRNGVGKLFCRLSMPVVIYSKQSYRWSTHSTIIIIHSSKASLAAAITSNYSVDTIELCVSVIYCRLYVVDRLRVLTTSFCVFALPRCFNHHFTSGKASQPSNDNLNNA